MKRKQLTQLLVPDAGDGQESDDSLRFFAEGIANLFMRGFSGG